MRTIENIKVGTQDVGMSQPAHVPGVRQGNSGVAPRKQKGFLANGGNGNGKQLRGTAHGSAQRSTGINPEARNPIDPRMPNLSPA